MILLDAIHINNGGGKILLDFLIESLEKSGLEVHYLLDSRVKGCHPQIKKNKTTYLESSVRQRHRFYKHNQGQFTKVFCFANMAPTVKLKIKVYTYFHQLLFLKTPSKLSLRNKMPFLAKRAFLKFFRNNSDYWIVQSAEVKSSFLKEIKPRNPDSVYVMPFYPPLQMDKPIKRGKFNYIYISGAAPHKNHIRLIEGFCAFYDQYQLGELTLTVSDDFTEVVELLERKKADGYPIVNLGFIQRNELSDLYLGSKYLIYPSLAESFGLGIIEAIECGCQVIGTDLPYTYAVCEPSIVFDPLEIASIVGAFEQSTLENIRPTKLLIKNKISELIKLLKD